MTRAPTRLAIADGEHARFVARDAGRSRGVWTLTSPAAGQRGSGLVPDRLGRNFESANVTRHAVEPRVDPHEREKRPFAAQVAAELNAAAARGLFSRLVLAAPTRPLGAVEQGREPDVRRRIAGRIGKNPTKVPDADPPAHFPSWPFVA